MMNELIRQWIQLNLQDWRSAKQLITLNNDVTAYYTKKGIDPEVKPFENLQEDELIEIYTSLSNLLKEEDRRYLANTIAFGMVDNTQEPNAIAVPILNGYAILYNEALDLLLISETELLFAYFFDATASISKETFELGYNTAILHSFFHAADYWSPIPVTGFTFREHVNGFVYIMSSFLVAHEMGHVLLHHFSNSSIRGGRVLPFAEDTTTIINPSAQFEFDADQFAIGLIYTENKNGSFKQNENIQNVQTKFIAIGWFFAILETIEILSQRLKIRLNDTHPSAAERWKRVSENIIENYLVSEEVRSQTSQYRSFAINTARQGILPIVHEAEFIARSESVKLPTAYSDHIHFLNLLDVEKWTPPSTAVFFDWLNAADFNAARTILLQNPQLLHRNMDIVHYVYAQFLKMPFSGIHILHKRLPLLQYARFKGVFEAFKDLEHNVIPVATEIVSLSDLPLPVIIEYQDLLIAKKTEECRNMEKEYPLLTKVMDVVGLLENLFSLKTTTNEVKSFLLKNSILLHPVFDGLFDRFIDIQQDKKAKDIIRRYHTIIRCCSYFGVSNYHLISPVVFYETKLKVKTPVTESTDTYVLEYFDKNTDHWVECKMLIKELHSVMTYNIELTGTAFYFDTAELIVAISTKYGIFWNMNNTVNMAAAVLFYKELEKSL